jgi:ribosomal protein S27E
MLDNFIDVKKVSYTNSNTIKVKILAINQLVFDGIEQDFYSFCVEVKCPVCNNDLSFLADDMISMEDLNMSSFPKGFTKQLNLKRRAGGNILENEKGLESYAMECECKACGTKSTVIAGIGEIQPTRLNVVVDGVVIV